MKGIELWRYIMQNPVGKELSVTMGGTGSAEALLFPDKIIVDADSAQASKDITITTPIDFKVTDMRIIHQDSTGCSVQLKNDSTAVTDDVTIAASDEDIDRASSIDDAQYEFSVGDDDLVLTPSSDALVGTVIIDIQPV